MKNWLHRMLFEYDSFGGLIFNYFIILFVFMFCWFWISMILNVLIYSIIEKKKKKEESKNGYDVKRDLKYDKIYEKIQGILEIPLFIPGLTIKFLIGFIQNKLNLDLTKNKSFIQWFIGFIIITSIWINWNDPFTDFMLLTKGKIVDGYIINSKQESEIVEINDGRSEREKFTYTYQYTFQTSDGNNYTNEETVNGLEPEEFTNLEETSLPVKVTYLDSNPKSSRIFSYTSKNTTIYEWFRFTVLYLIIFVSIWSYIMIKKE